MKIYPLMALFLMSTATYAADWSPVFAHLEVGKKGDDTIVNNIQIIKPNISSSTHDVLTYDAKKGVYKHLPQPYRADMLPAKVVKGKDTLEAVIPLKNATLYGYPLESLTEYYGCFDCGDVGFYATFKPMSDKQFQALSKKVKFKQVDYAKGVEGYGCLTEGEPIAGFHKDKGKVHLVIYMGC